MIARTILVLSGALALSACASNKVYGEAPGITLLSTSQLPAPYTDGSGQPAYDARIGRFDRVTVDVRQFEDLTDRDFTVDGTGHIALPIVGAVQVAGLTVGQASDAIAERFRAAHVRDPEVSVNFDEMSSNYVTVHGSVVMPGNYPVLDGMTLTRAVAAARGINDYARRRDVVVLREVDGQSLAALYDLEEIERANYEDPLIYPHDTVIVGESPQRRLIQTLLEASPFLVGPIIALIQN